MAGAHDSGVLRISVQKRGRGGREGSVKDQKSTEKLNHTTEKSQSL